MKTLIATIMFAIAGVGPLMANSPLTPSEDATVVAAVKQVELDMGDAMVAVDIDKLAQFYADDFATIGSSGKIITKKDILNDFASFHDKLISFECGPIDVQVFGNVAMAHGSVSEKRMRDGKDTSGNFVWTDLLEKRAGKWVVVRSAGARMK
jgi:ketosteroid isomerase-like protein